MTSKMDIDTYAKLERMRSEYVEKLADGIFKATERSRAIQQSQLLKQQAPALSNVRADFRNKMIATHQLAYSRQINRHPNFFSKSLLLNNG